MIQRSAHTWKGQKECCHHQGCGKMRKLKKVAKVGPSGVSHGVYFLRERQICKFWMRYQLPSIFDGTVNTWYVYVLRFLLRFTKKIMYTVCSMSMIKHFYRDLLYEASEKHLQMARVKICRNKNFSWFLLEIMNNILGQNREISSWGGGGGGVQCK